MRETRNAAPCERDAALGSSYAVQKRLCSWEAEAHQCRPINGNDDITFAYIWPLKPKGAVRNGEKTIWALPKRHNLRCEYLRIKYGYLLALLENNPLVQEVESHKEEGENVVPEDPTCRFVTMD